MRRGLAQPKQILKKLRVGFCRAVWVGDEDPGLAEADEGEAHGHAMVVVGFDRRRAKWTGVDRETVWKFVDREAQAAEFGDDGQHAVGLFEPHVSDVANAGGAAGEGGDAGERLGGIADVVHVDIDPVERLASGRSGQGDALRAPFGATAHLHKDVDKPYIALQCLAIQTLDGDATARHGCGREEIAGG